MDQNALREEHRQGGYQIRTVHINIRVDYPAYGDTPEIDSTTKNKYDSYRNGAASVLLSTSILSRPVHDKFSPPKSAMIVMFILSDKSTGGW
jgi:hypothetical protein